MFLDTAVVIDFETTGMSPERGDRITEVGLVRLEGGCVTGRYESLVNCGVRVPTFITAYTGITQQMVDHAPRVQQVIQEMLDFIGNEPLVAHNACFDRRFLGRECLNVGARAPLGRFLCSLRLARRVYPQFESHALSAIARVLDIQYVGSAHRAMADANVTAQVLLELGRALKMQYAALHIDVALLREVMEMPIKHVPARLQRRVMSTPT
ncbi:MAG: 3'-5' exonuclease [Steroidobacteraceae bacterium]